MTWSSLLTFSGLRRQNEDDSDTGASLTCSQVVICAIVPSILHPLHNPKREVLFLGSLSKEGNWGLWQ